MKILELHIKSFGRYKDKKIVFRDGMNIIYGENEAGKTTIYTFIKAMLYGLERGRGRASSNDTFTQYEPWENPNFYAGSMRFECGDRTFCLDRSFDRYGKKVSLICEDDGEVLSVEHGDLDILLDGMDEAGFENTSAVGQMKIETGPDLAAELKNYAANYYLTGNGDLNLDDALEQLNSRKKTIEKEMKETVQKRQDQRELLEQEASFVWRDIRRFQMELQDVQEEIRQYREDEEEKQSPGRNTEELNIQPRKWRVHPVEWIGLITFIVLALIFIRRPWNNLTAIVIALAEGMYIWNRLKEGSRKKKTAEGEESIQEPDGKKERERLLWQQDRLMNELKEKEIAHGNIQETIEELELTGEDYRRQGQKRKALELAQTRLKELSLDIHKELSADLNKKASGIMEEITEGKYSRLFIDENLKMSIFAQGRRIPAERVSRGTLEQVYLALRMASIEVLYTEVFPIILDDTFVFYDEKRLGAVLRWLYANKNQVFVLTCQRREQQILEAENIPYFHISV